MKISRKIFHYIGIFPIIDDYYEPCFDPVHLRKSLRDDRYLPGIDMNIEEQLMILSGFDYNSELLGLPIEKTNDYEFHYKNGFFESGEAEYLYSIIRSYKPKRIIEIGSGYSTLMSIKSLNANSYEDSSYLCKYTCIDPYSKVWLEKENIKLVKERVENIDKDLFTELCRNDILFIDSSHIIRPQGDVLFEYLEILPILKSGVLVHIHDVFTPKDYSYEWIFNQVRFWNEQYLLEAFLSMNNAYRIIGALNYLKHNFPEQLFQKCPILKINQHYDPRSFWIVRN
jgi:predicted O-methyltransferase YrrM